jgi:chromosome segregation ATPase
MELTKELYEAIITIIDDRVKDIKVTREEFDKLRKSIEELAEAQKKTEERLTRLEEAIERLAEAQRKTEERLNELAEAQKKTEERVSRLEEVVERLAEAQKKTEERVSRLEEAVERLAEAQRKTEERVLRLEEAVERLTEAQMRTEEEIRKLTIGLKETREMVAGLSDTVGYGLEDRAMKYLPELLKNRFNINLKTPLIRKYVTYNGEEEELNIYGKGEKDGREIDIIGEAKSRPSKKDVEKFLKKINRLEKMKIISDSKFLLIVGYTIRPEVELYARKNNIEVIWSYEVQ